MSFLLLVVASAASAAASAPSSHDQEAPPQPEVIIHFPHTSDVACWPGACSVAAGGRCVHFHLASVLGAHPACRFLPDDMSLTRRHQLVSMFRDISRPDHLLECATRTLWSLKELRSAEFEVVRGRDRRLCRVAAEARVRDSAVGLGPPPFRGGFTLPPEDVLLRKYLYPMPPPEGYKPPPADVPKIITRFVMPPPEGYNPPPADVPKIITRFDMPPPEGYNPPPADVPPSITLSDMSLPEGSKTKTRNPWRHRPEVPTPRPRTTGRRWRWIGRRG